MSNRFNVKLDFIKPQLKVTIQTNKRNYAKVALMVDEMICNDISYSEININQN
jgi:hypothetical protein